MRLINRFFLLFILLCPLLGYTQVWQTKPLDRVLLAQGKSNMRPANNNQEKRLQQEIKKLLILAEKQLILMQLTLPAGNNAYETYRRVLKIDPNNNDAKRGLVKIGDQYQKIAEQYAKRGLLKKSLRIIKRGLRVAPDHSGLLAQQAVVEKALLWREAARQRQLELAPKLEPAPSPWSGGSPKLSRPDGGWSGRLPRLGSFAVVRVLYATDRNRTSEVKPAEMFGNDRGTLRFGYCEVSIPRGHRIGELESPSIWRLEFREDPDKHVVLLNTVIRSKDDFFEDLRARVHDSVKSSAFLFVHGYNVTFEDAAKRTAQISQDLSFDGAPVFYSWPSQGMTPAYTIDEQNIEWAQSNLKNFLEDFFERSDAQNVYLIAHSMGNRALARAVASLLTDKPIIRGRLKEVILAAPDIDAEVFKRDIVPALTKTDSPVTLYASSEDLALALSKQFHGYPRAGDSGQGLVVVPGIETIDATHVDTGLLGHSYFAETRSIIDDMYYLIGYSHRADQRFGLRRVDAQVGRYWEFKQ
jgi:esterase/lipase superfamily enzyme